MITINEAAIENFPYKEGDRVKVMWAYPHGLVEKATIHKLHTSIQWGRNVVYAIMIVCDGEEKPRVASFDCLTKLIE